MNSRHNPGRITRKEQCSSRKPAGDQRHLVLICIGLLLIAASVAGRTIPKKSAATTAGTLIWLAGSTIDDGVYRVDTRELSPDADHLSSLYHRFGMIPPAAVAHSGPGFGRQQDQIPGLLLENRQPPVAVSPPAVYYSFMFQPIPINEADRELLTTVPGIGSRLAEEILVLRKKKDRFSSPEELLDVPGIGQVRLQRFAKHFSFKQSGT
jgi:competence protein ComEA